MKIFRRKHVNRLCSVSLAIAITLLLASTSHASKIRHLWQSNDQFVAVEHQDSLTTGPALPNNHPAELTLDRITAMLASINIGSAENGKPQPLFTGPAVQIIAPHLLHGLRQASPAEDVTFAVIGLHDAMYGLARSPKVTTGRIFYQAGRLNIIIGLAQQEVRDRDDRRLFPFTPGARKEALEGEWQLLPQPSRKGCELVRKDWITFGDEWQTPVAGQNVPSRQTTPVERLTTLKELKEKGLITDEEYRGKRLEILNGL